MKIGFSDRARVTSGSIVVAAAAGGKLLPTAQALDKTTKGVLSRAVKASGRFDGQINQTLDIAAPAGVKLDHIVLIGLGEETEIDDLAAEALGGTIIAKMNALGVKSVSVALDEKADAARVAYGAMLRSYRFDKYRTKESAKDKPSLTALTVSTKDAAKARRAYGPLAKIAEGVAFTRDLVSEPANVIFPATLAREAKKLEKMGVKVTVFDEKQLKRMGAGALLGVAQGSIRPARMVVMQWTGGRKGSKPVAFVGKGVTFDTGGISLKPPAGMEDMKWDMGGAGVVVGLMRALAGRKSKVNAVGVVGLVENMPSGAAQRPGDIVKSMSGQTIEVLNTDAEGRLVLADALWYTQKEFKPRLMVDLATLTGAIIVALGHEHAGLMSNDDDLAEKLLAAGRSTGEKIWRLPLAKAYDKAIDCDIADMKNIGGRDAGSITAAQFLQRFVNEVPWAHLDIAGVTWSKNDAPTVPKGGTGFGVRLLDRFVADNFEGK